MEVRADTYLWAVRMYKSRSLASDAIKGGKVKLNGNNFKPSHTVRPGEVYTLSIGHNKKIIEVLSLIEKRGSFEVALKHYKDLSPAPQKTDKLPSAFFKNNVQRERGSGRPSKKDRRDLDDLNYF
jgi:ribosome-associated heat shock protein Hsp15